MEFIAKIFRNKANGQCSIAIPKKIAPIKLKQMPNHVKVKISIPKDYIGVVKKCTFK